MYRSSLFNTSILFLAVFCASSAASERVPWTSSRISGSPEPPKPFHIEPAYPNLQFNNPVEVKTVPGTNQILVLQVTGELLAFRDDAGCAESRLVLNVGSGKPKMRAFGFGLHPRFPERPELFLVYAPEHAPIEDASHLSRFTFSDVDELTIDPASEQRLLSWRGGGHNGSTVQFDSEGLLYFSIGDGARPYPPDEYDQGQNLADIHSSICRIDIDQTQGDLPYRIPDDNPFVNVPGARGEIWAFGFRNPWRFSIDPNTGRIFCGDVGWELWESVFDVRRGGNYGWSLFEGPQPIRQDLEPAPVPISKPLATYSHSVGQSVTGGFTYRGEEFVDLEGWYLYGDYVSGLLWGLKSDGDQVTANPILAETGLPIITFSQNRQGDVLVVSYSGTIHRLIRNPLLGQPNPFPKRLSETGLFGSLPSLKPAPGVYEYDLTTQSHHPGVKRSYHVAVPGNETVKIGKLPRAWKYPIGTVFVRTYSVEDETSESDRRLETQILHFNGLSWQPYSYLWNEDQTDADLVPSDGGLFSLEDGHGGTIDWTIQNRSQCRSCHTNQAGGAVGFSLENLSKDQIQDFVDLRVLDQNAPKWWKVRSMCDPADSTQPIESRARSYLAANCAHCHLRGGGGSVPLDLTYSNPSEIINAIDFEPTQGTFEMKGAKVIAPGRPFQSVLLYRMSTSGVGRMPKMSQHDPEPFGIKLVHDWIASMDETDSEMPDGDSKTSRSLAALIEVIRNDRSDEAQEYAKAAMESGDVLAEGLFQHYLPKDQRRRQLGGNIDPEQILALKGDPARGRAWMASTRGSACTACHRVEGLGNYVGPALDGIGSKRDLKHLLNSILKPSAEIDPKYQTVSILDVDGQAVSGIQIDEDDQRMVIRSADGKDHLIERDDIEIRKLNPQSIMPMGLAETMTAAELADLVAYLSSMK